MKLFVSIFLVFVLDTGIVHPQVGNIQPNPRSTGSQTVVHRTVYYECPTSEFCANGGTCYMEVNKKFRLYLCKCQDKYYGETCQFRRTDNAKPCQVQIADYFCLNGGTCYEDSVMNETIYHCGCPEQLWGARCEANSPGEIQNCSDVENMIFCKNGGTCYETNIGGGKYQFCLCTDEYVGIDCDFKVVEDNSSVILNELLCLNEGACYRVIWEDVEIFSCICPKGYHGDRCEYRTSGTSSACPDKYESFCLNGGFCSQEVCGSKKTFYCGCLTRYTGQRCEITLSHEPQQCVDLGDKFCANGGTCFDVSYVGITLRYCECPYEFGGTRCEIKLPREGTCPPPFDTEVCANNGTCLVIDTGRNQTAYICRCAEGYYGTTCEYRETFQKDYSECPAEVVEFFCKNHGTCYKDMIMSRPFYYCECVRPYHGVRCDQIFTKWYPCPAPLNTDLCLSGGVCSQVAAHFPSLYFCECTKDHFGARCEHCFRGRKVEDYPCPQPLDKFLCKNGGTCFAPKLNALTTAFYCVCPEGLYGTSCEYPYSIMPIEDACPSDMEKTFCLNGGTCFQEKFLGHTVHVCECDYPYTGERCELMSIKKLSCPQQVANILCLSGGSCTYRKSNGYNVYFCECPEGSYGARCEHISQRTRDCPPGIKKELCQNGGICVTLEVPLVYSSVYFCKCVAGFFGLLCEFPHSSIESTSVFCPQNIAEYYCENGGTCHTSRITGDAVYYCLCPHPYYGITCEFKYPSVKCPQSIAHHLCVHGTCIQKQSNGVDTYQCVCTAGFYGARCEHQSQDKTTLRCGYPFTSLLCKNNGTLVCLSSGPIVYYCECPFGFFGTACEIPHNPALEEIEPCRLDVAQSYCLNGGTCYRKGNRGKLVSFCECMEPYYGARCQYRLPYKSPCPLPFSAMLCVRGSCTPRVSHGEMIYTCECEEGYYGYRCEHGGVTVYQLCPHPLENDLCANAGACVLAIFKEKINLYFCKCMEGYYGMSCEYKKTLPHSPDCPQEIAKEWCLHGGKCYAEDTINHVVYRCECASPYYGERCEKHPFMQPACPSSMNKNLCFNGGTCTPITINRYIVYHCKCTSEYFGTRCEFCFNTTKEGLCPSHLRTDLCKNGGTCIITIGREEKDIYYCKCPEGLYGVSCEYPYPRLATLDYPCPACADETYCQHGGTCYKEDIMGHSMYHCKCVYPYHGEQCNVKFPQQLNCPNQFNYFLCLNSGTCVRGESNGHIIYTCLCQDGYYGPRCEHTCGPIESPAMICEDPFYTELCKNGGTCVKVRFPAGNAILFCKCRPGLFGVSCEYPFLPLFHGDTVCPPEVAKDYCLNGGSCYTDVDPQDTFYYCFCPDSYFGDRCEISFPAQKICPREVEEKLCLNGGRCVQLHTVSHYIYVCWCSGGFYGSRCQYSKHRSDSNMCPPSVNHVLCMNGGTCVVLTTGKDQQLYFCICVEGFYGVICEYKIPPADAVGESCPPVLEQKWCLNGGTCYVGSVVGITVYYCVCVEPFNGDRCEMESPGLMHCPHILDKFLCINGGVCTKRILHQPPTVLYYCDCPTRYSGARCEIPASTERKVRYCEQFKWFCFNGGVCLEEVFGGSLILHCDCKKGYYGERCQLKTQGLIVCPPEYKGHICFNGGTCKLGSTSLRKTTYCECHAGYLGQRCEFTEPKIKTNCPNEINEYLCLNGGTCLEETIDKHKLYYCECPQQNFGLRCEYESPKGDSCLSKDFCLNGGTCYSFEFSRYTVYYCQCEPGYHGSICQYQIQEPVSEKLCPPEIADWFCFNGGTCFRRTLNNNVDYYCICLTGIAGYRCEYVEQAGQSCLFHKYNIFCLNHGTCYKVSDSPIALLYFCACPVGYGGKRCEYVNQRIDRCPVKLETSLCLNNGNCSVLVFIGYVIYYCECPTGYYGPRCQDSFPVPIHEKTCPENIDQHFCLNGGTCRQTVSQKLVINYCICVEGYWGERCEYSYSDQTSCSDEFDQFYCLNGGTCYKLTVGKDIFQHCECLKNFFGRRCESLYPEPGPESQRCVGEIDTYFCENGGTCYQILLKNELFYFCTCPVGWTGLRCEDGPVTKQNCQSELVAVYCLNNGTCIKLKFGSQELYYCRCAKGFEGPRCEYNLPNVDSRACPTALNELYCLNSGTCSEITVLDEMFYMCDCAEGFWGMRCEFTKFIRNFCPAMLDTGFCLNGGTCYQLLIDDKDLYYCVCTNIRYGTRCEYSYIGTNETQLCPTDLSEEICLSGGTCYQLNTSNHPVFYCVCAEGFSGDRCQLPPSRHLHVNYLKLQHSLETSSSSTQMDICLFLFLLWFVLCCKTV